MYRDPSFLEKYRGAEYTWSFGCSCCRLPKVSLPSPMRSTDYSTIRQKASVSQLPLHCVFYYLCQKFKNKRQNRFYCTTLFSKWQQMAECEGEYRLSGTRLRRWRNVDKFKIRTWSYTAGRFGPNNSKTEKKMSVCVWVENGRSRKNACKAIFCTSLRRKQI